MARTQTIGKRACGPVRPLTGWLSLAATPVFAVMSWISATGPQGPVICGTVSAVLPIDDMTLMYVLMALFHLPPWLRAASGRVRRFDHTETKK